MQTVGGLQLLGWLIQTAFCLVLALVAAALMPKQLRAVQRSWAQAGASLGWGALAFFVIAPAVLVVLVISVVGLLLVLPYVLFVLAVLLLRDHRGRRVPGAGCSPGSAARTT